MVSENIQKHSNAMHSKVKRKNELYSKNKQGCQKKSERGYLYMIMLQLSLKTYI